LEAFSICKESLDKTTNLVAFAVGIADGMRLAMGFDGGPKPAISGGKHRDSAG
jgi:hypothetical protein